MRTAITPLVICVSLGLSFFAADRASAQAAPATRPAMSKAPEWSMNATIIEACSCPMFCQCYFNDEPAAHAAGAGGAGHDHAAPAGHHHGGGAGEHFCKFNNAYRVNRGRYGATQLDGARFWIAGDLGGDFSKGQMDWAVLTFDPSVTPEQRGGIQEIVGRVYPVQWASFRVAPDARVRWEADKDRAVATLDDGKAGEVRLHRFQGMTDQPIVISNLRYWGAPRNDGFILMPSELEAYRAGDKPFQFKGTNGFMITFDITSKDVPAQPGAAK